MQAAQWYRKAAEQGNANAHGTLAVLYSVGQGVPQDYADAYRWIFPFLRLLKHRNNSNI